MKLARFVASSLLLAALGCGPRSTPEGIPPVAPDLFSRGSSSSSDEGFEFDLDADAEPEDEAGADGGFGSEPAVEGPPEAADAAANEADEPPPSKGDAKPKAGPKKPAPTEAEDQDRGGF